MPPPDASSTAAFYARQAEAYFRRTSTVDLSPLYGTFETRLRPGARILDLGSGSGRDARHFAASGFDVVAVDPCAELQVLAVRHTPPELTERISYEIGAAPGLTLDDASFDAVWAMASLLHLPRGQMLPALEDCRRVLTPGGWLALGMKEGTGDVDDGGRFCALWSLPDLRRTVINAGFAIIAENRRPSLDGRDLTWLNILAVAELKRNE